MEFGAYFHPLTKCHTGDDVKYAQRRSLMWTLASGGVQRGGQLLSGTLRISRGESGSALRTHKRPRFSLSTTGSDILSYYASKLGGNTRTEWLAWTVTSRRLSYTQLFLGVMVIVYLPTAHLMYYYNLETCAQTRVFVFYWPLRDLQFWTVSLLPRGLIP